VVVLNLDDPNAEFLYSYAWEQSRQLRIVFYSLVANEAMKGSKLYKAEHIEHIEDGYIFHVKLSNLSFDLRLHLDGVYNVQNAMGALSACVALDMPVQGIVTGIEAVRSIPGRMQILQKNPFYVIVDFAHTPNAHEQVLHFLTEEHKGGKLIIVFGCAGRRDASKRKPMGNIASTYADYIILTSEDPRDEDFNEICNDIMSGIDKQKFKLNSNLFCIQSREEAIAFAITKLAREGDIVALLGKGHEKSNCIGTVEYPWNEEEVALQYIHGLKKT